MTGEIISPEECFNDAIHLRIETIARAYKITSATETMKTE